MTMDAREILLALRGEDDVPAEKAAKSVQDLLAAALHLGANGVLDKA